MKPLQPLGRSPKIPVFFLLSLFVGIPRLFTLAVSDSLFLVHYGAESLAWAYLGRAVAIPLLGLVLFQAEKRFTNRKILLLLEGIMAAATLVFLFFFTQTTFREPYLALLVWVSVEWTLTGVVFWNSANRFFSLREGKEWFGRISSGEVAAGILGGGAIPLLLAFLSPRDLLWFSLAGHGSALLVLAWLPASWAGKNSESLWEEADRPPSGLGEVLRNPYLLGVFSLTAFDFSVHYVADNFFLQTLQAEKLDAGAMTGFMGAFLGALNLVILAFRFGLSEKILHKLGLRRTLPVTALFIILTALVVVLIPWLPSGTLPLLGLAALMKFGQMALSEGLFAPSFYLLFQPLATRDRTRVQNFSEGVPGRLAGGLMGILLLALGAWGILTPRAFALILLVLGVCWAAVAGRTAQGYAATLRDQVRVRRLPGTPEPLRHSPRSAAPGGLPEDLASPLEEVLDLRDRWFSLADREQAPWVDAFLSEELQRRTDEVLALLALDYPGDDLTSLTPRLYSPEAAMRSYALEYLESLLSPERSQKLIPLLERGRGGNAPRRSPGDFFSLAGSTSLVRSRPLLSQALARAAVLLGRDFVPPLPPALPEIQFSRLLFLRTLPLFQDMTAETLRPLAQALVPQSWKPGEAILRRGEEGHSLIILARGRVRIHDGPRILAEMDQGSFFGEYTALSPGIRTATVTALTPCGTYTLEGRDLMNLILTQEKALQAVLKVLGTRLAAKDYRPAALETPFLPLLKSLESDQLQALGNLGGRYNLRQGEVLGSPGGPGGHLCLVVTGAVDWGGMEAGPGVLLEEASGLGLTPLGWKISAKKNSRILKMSSRLFAELLQCSPGLLPRYLSDLVGRITRTYGL